MAATMELVFVMSEATARDFGPLFEIISDGWGRVDIGRTTRVPFWEALEYTLPVFQRVCKMLISRRMPFYYFWECANRVGTASYGAVNLRWRFAFRTLSRRT